MKLLRAFYAETKGRTFKANLTHLAGTDDKPLCGNPTQVFGDGRKAKYWLQEEGLPTCRYCCRLLAKVSK